MGIEERMRLTEKEIADAMRGAGVTHIDLDDAGCEIRWTYWDDNDDTHYDDDGYIETATKVDLHNEDGEDQVWIHFSAFGDFRVTNAPFEDYEDFPECALDAVMEYLECEAA